eukprot:gnl/Chilomastix_cuspidata/10049.p2 GENE.gnl/Chilomastix_cuspidata/10049~~gnl/Chilomastix_cuspidata/10049.p2  ORF type:complete len:129 (+),score=11.09 gnl/Chilomastix_cuspidata/10049:1429-1815(+)
MSKDYPRSARIGSQIQEVVSEILVKKTKDPRLSGVAITAVKMSGDLSSAYVYFSVYSDDKKAIKDAENGFKSAKGFFKKVVGNQLKLRYTPELKFMFDSTMENARRMEDLLKTIKKEEDWSDDGEQDS